jgi:hypothetical protein
VLFPQRHQLSRCLKPERVLFRWQQQGSGVAGTVASGQKGANRQAGISLEIPVR